MGQEQREKRGQLKCTQYAWVSQRRHMRSENDGFYLRLQCQDAGIVDDLFEESVIFGGFGNKGIYRRRS